MTETERSYATGDELHSLFRTVFALHRALSERMDVVHETAGLGTPQVKVLDSLKRLGSATVPDVAADQGFSRQFALIVCHELEERGLIGFADNPRHRRSRLASLTHAGGAALVRFRDAEADLIGRALPDLDATDVAVADSFLQEILDRIAAAR